VEAPSVIEGTMRREAGRDQRLREGRRKGSRLAWNSRLPDTGGASSPGEARASGEAVWPLVCRAQVPAARGFSSKISGDLHRILHINPAKMQESRK
jgi:hypothetical protein